MKEFLTKMQHSLMAKLIVAVRLMLLASMTIWAVINIQAQRERMRARLVAGVDRRRSP